MSTCFGGVMKYGCLQRLQLCFRPVRQTSPTRRHIKTSPLCGDVTDYVFTPNTLTVKFHDGRPANVFKITKYTYTNDSVSIDWLKVTAKSRSRFSLNSLATLPPWRSSRTVTSRVDHSIAAENQFSRVFLRQDNGPIGAKSCSAGWPC